MAYGVNVGNLLAISDLHVGYPENREIVAGLQAGSDSDWLLVAGDVGDLFGDIEWALGTLADRFATVVWAPGNHELWSSPKDPVRLRGEARYQALVEMCRRLGVLTPEDPYPRWEGPGGPVRVAPLFLLYDYSFRPPGCATKEEGLEYAHRTGVVCVDEHLLHPDPYPSREAWCHSRLAATASRLDALGGEPTVLVSHWPLVREPTDIMWYPEFAQWCGTELTADWHLRYHCVSAVYGHLHIPRTIECDGVPFIEVSVGYPREWRKRPGPVGVPRRILPSV
jgi:3',5'-cyclic AMP phosphodiesterase CpdA